MSAHRPLKEAPDPGVPTMPNQEADEIAAFLEGAVSAGASSQEVAEAIVAAFRGIGEVLMPIVGQRGVAALYKRSLHLSNQVHPWLPVSREVPTTMDFAALTPALAQQTATEAAAAGVRLLQTFYGLLNRLIGPALTERLLRPVSATFLSGSSALDTTP